MKASVLPVRFRENAAHALQNPVLRRALDNATGVFGTKRADAFSSTPLEAWREKASELRLHVLDNLSDCVEQFSRSAVKSGATVHRAEDACTACEIITSILKDHAIDRVVKSKSMISEEIGLNHHLENHGITPVETDLGEYIIQCAVEHPSHIIVPAIHKDRRQVGRLFSEKLGCLYTDDPATLTNVARQVLREEFLSAKAGISGANFAIAESGSIVLVTNEGNGRMCTSLPKLHIAVLSLEKIIPSLSDLPTLIRLLPRSATGQIITSYLSLISGTRKPGEFTGAEELHLVLLDNGRSTIVQTQYREMLKCIRCGACLNACPVYRVVGGHAYDSTYPGPMGIVLTTLLDGMARAHPLLDATTLCGACGDVCPVKVPLPKLLRMLKEEKVERGFPTLLEKAGIQGFGAAVTSRTLFEIGQIAFRALMPLARMVGPDLGLGRLPAPAARPFTRRFQ